MGRAVPPGADGAARRVSESAPVPCVGDARLLDGRLLGLLSSIEVPPSLIVPTVSLARQLAGSRAAVVGGFQTPLERLVLDVLLAGTADVVVCLSRAANGARLPRRWRAEIDRGRLAVVSAADSRRPTFRSGVERNRIVVALSDRLWTVSAPVGSRTYAAAALAIDRGTPVHCFDHPMNWDLQLRGGQPIRPSAGADEMLADLGLEEASREPEGTDAERARVRSRSPRSRSRSRSQEVEH